MAEPKADVSTLKTLMAIFEKQKPDGTYLYTDAEVRHYLPYLVLAAKVPLDQLHESVQLLVGQLVVDAKLDLKAGAEKVQQQIEAYYNSKPVNAELHKAVMGFVRETLSSGGDEQRAALASALLGKEQATGVLGGGVRPAGTSPGGMAARLAAMTQDKKKK